MRQLIKNPGSKWSLADWVKDTHMARNQLMKPAEETIWMNFEPIGQIGMF